MTTGPIEFLSDAGPAHEHPATEYGGADGLIQPAKDEILSGDPEASGGHSVMGSQAEVQGERSSMAMRAAMAPLSLREQKTGEADQQGVMVDPATGMQVPQDWAVDGESGKPSDLKPY